MARNENVDGRSGLAKVLLAVGLAAVALDSLRKEKRLLAAVTGGAAVALGYTATAKSAESGAEPDAHSIEPISRSRELRCDICGEPIVAGQGRQPHPEYGTVHDACLE
ncbi:hypothetical protein [Natronomonas amylolytica]|uniref:hypothetical protein n=1 Tax=Natronomonas amylolytica TaxID=3108498 RepID=UPI00300953A4